MPPIIFEGRRIFDDEEYPSDFDADAAYQATLSEERLQRLWNPEPPTVPPPGYRLAGAVDRSVTPPLIQEQRADREPNVCYICGIRTPGIRNLCGRCEENALEGIFEEGRAGTPPPRFQPTPLVRNYSKFDALRRRLKKDYRKNKGKQPTWPRVQKTWVSRYRRWKPA